MAAGLRARVVRLDTLDEPARADVRALMRAGAGGPEEPAVSDQARLDLETRGGGDDLLAVLVLDGQSRLAGYGALARRAGHWALEPATGPGGPWTRDEITSAVVGAALDEIGRRGGGMLRLWAHGHDPSAPEPPPAPGGFRLERELLQLRVRLPVPDGRSPVALRTFRPGIDEPAWVAVNNRAFAGHPEQSGWTLHDVQRRESEPWFDPGGFLLHEVTGRLAAFCWTKVHPGGTLGEIYVIGVDPDFQGRGLGRALTVAGLDHLAGRGVPTGMLYVDAANAAAVSLYRSLGFSVHHIDRAYVADVAGEATGARGAAESGGGAGRGSTAGA